MSSNDGNDMLGAVKLAALLHKVWELDHSRWLGAREAWRMGTVGSAEAAGDPEGLGRISVGARADLVLLDLDSIVFTPLNDPLLQVALSPATPAVRSALVGGRWSLRDGALTRVDEAAVLAEARELGAAIVARHDEAFEVGRQLLASVRAGWLEALGSDVGVNRSASLERR